jgi:aryl-alcohol dehydrogenase-like predicted oxidoreductase
VATKFGLVASTPHPIVRLLERPLRAVLKAMPGLRRSTIRAATQAVGPLHHPTDFSVENAAASLAQSLRALETDYVDMLLLHEVRPEDLREEALLTWLRDVQAQGRVGRIGLATSVEASAEILTAHPDTFDIVQVPVNPLCGPLPAPVAAFDGVLIAHSVFNPVLAIIQDRARDDGRWGDEFQRETGVDPTDKEALARHLVAAVSQALPHGIVLVGASSPEHIRVAPSYLNTVQLPPDALGQLARLVSRGGSDPS